jgi:hypothetical protein
MRSPMDAALRRLTELAAASRPPATEADHQEAELVLAEIAELRAMVAAGMTAGADCPSHPDPAIADPRPVSGPSRRLPAPTGHHVDTRRFPTG